MLGCLWILFWTCWNRLLVLTLKSSVLSLTHVHSTSVWVTIILSFKYYPSAIFFIASFCCCCSVAKLCLALQPHELQHVRLPWPLLSPAVCSKSGSLSQWCHPIISPSVVPFSSCPQAFPASGYFPMSWLCCILYSKAKLACYFRYLLTSNFCILIPYDEKDVFFLVLVLEGLVGFHKIVQLLWH